LERIAPAFEHHEVKWLGTAKRLQDLIEMRVAWDGRMLTKMLDEYTVDDSHEWIRISNTAPRVFLNRLRDLIDK